MSIQLENYKKTGKNIIPYGTSGFRERADLLYLVSFRLGIYLGYYSKVKPDKVLGVQISASHNPYEDNGLKIAQWDGGMLDQQQE